MVANTELDLREYDSNDRVELTIDAGETFVGMLTDRQHDPHDGYVEGSVRFLFEGELWEQVRDRVDSEVLHVSQDFDRNTGRPKEARLHGTVWVGEDEESSVPEYEQLGTITKVERND